jgi:hypothetical protein
MNIIEQIKELSLDYQVLYCGGNVIPFINKILNNDIEYYKCNATIKGHQTTLSSIILICSDTRKDIKIYIPDHFEVYVEEFITSDNVFMILDVALDNIHNNYGHCNALIINKNLMTVERFEPTGKPLAYDDKRIENTIKKFVKTYFVGFNYLSPYTFIGNEGPQKKTSLSIKLKLQPGTGLCVNYTILYLYLRCKEKLDPYESIEFINAYFLDENILKFTNFVNNCLLQ